MWEGAVEVAGLDAVADDGHAGVVVVVGKPATGEAIGVVPVGDAVGGHEPVQFAAVVGAWAQRDLERPGAGLDDDLVGPA